MRARMQSQPSRGACGSDAFRDRLNVPQPTASRRELSASSTMPCHRSCAAKHIRVENTEGAVSESIPASPGVVGGGGGADILFTS